MDYTMIISQGTIILGVLVALTNIITEVAKMNISALSSAESINRFATIVGILLTVGVGIAYAQINSIMLSWYHIVALIIIGFMVALASMVGFDKVISYFEGIRG